MTLAILCSGQGPQHPDMFALTGDAPAAAILFARAATLLDGRDPRDVVHAGDGVLHRNGIGQILCTLQALAAAAALADTLAGRRVIAGYSIGEVAAWGVAGLIGGTDTLDLAARRADAMDAATRPGDGLLFVRGLRQATIDDLCRRHAVDVSIVNPGEAFVLGGAGESLDALGREAARLGALRVARVAVNVASHTPRLAAASAGFREALDHVRIGPGLETGTRLLAGIDGTPVLDVARGLDKLADQISRTVRWADCLAACVEAGAHAFLELGPGRALAEMAAGAYPDIPARSLDDFRSLRGAGEWLARVAG